MAEGQNNDRGYGFLRVKDRNGNTPLHVAAKAGSSDVLRTFLAMDKWALEERNALGRTPLYLAVLSGNKRAATVLLDAGADVTTKANDGSSLWGAASTSRNPPKNQIFTEETFQVIYNNLEMSCFREPVIRFDRDAESKMNYSCLSREVPSVFISKAASKATDAQVKETSADEDDGSGNTNVSECSAGSHEGSDDSQEGSCDSQEGSCDSQEGSGDSQEGSGDSQEGSGVSQEGSDDLKPEDWETINALSAYLESPSGLGSDYESTLSERLEKLPLLSSIKALEKRLAKSMELENILIQNQVFKEVNILTDSKEGAEEGLTLPHKAGGAEESASTSKKHNVDEKPKTENSCSSLEVPSIFIFRDLSRDRDAVKKTTAGRDGRCSNTNVSETISGINLLSKLDSHRGLSAPQQLQEERKPEEWEKIYSLAKYLESSRGSESDSESHLEELEQHPILSSVQALEKRLAENIENKLVNKECSELLDPEWRDEEGLTVLHRAAISRAEECVSSLIKHSVDVNAKTEFGETAFMLASMSGSTKIMDMLLDAGADCKHVDDFGRTALHIAANWKRLEVVKKLLALGLDPNQQCNAGDNALHYAAIIPGNASILEELVAHGADKSMKNNLGYPPIAYATETVDDDMIKPLEL